MRSADEICPKSNNDDRFTVRECSVKQWQLNRFFYHQIGKTWAWNDKSSWSDAQWLEYVECENLRTFVAYYDGVPAGYFELNENDVREIEIAYFGLLSEYCGRGFGGVLLTEALIEAWSLGPSRVWVHTCTADHVAALPNYQSRGMKVYQVVPNEV